MKIVIPDDYQNAVRTLDCFKMLDGHQVTTYQDHVSDTETQASRFQEADALVLIRERTPITGELLALLPNLKVIVQTGKQAPHLDQDACSRHGVEVIFAAPMVFGSSGKPYATAELTWALVMAAMRHIPQEVAFLKEGHWQQTLGLSIYNRVLGIYSYGNIGSLVASYGRAFGMRVMVWGREGSRSRAESDGFASANSREEFFRESDVLCLHLRATEETRGVVTAEDLAKMKSTAVLVNTSRARLIAPGALVEALKNGHPGYAAVDVYEQEPVTDKDNPLLHMDNVICTPHLGYVEKDTYENIFSAAFEQVLLFAAKHS